MFLVNLLIINKINAYFGAYLARKKYALILIISKLSAYLVRRYGLAKRKKPLFLSH
jgi:hypothetical protein